MFLPIYLLALAAFLLFLNLKSASAPGKWFSYIGMWGALGASATSAVLVYS